MATLPPDVIRKIRESRDELLQCEHSERFRAVLSDIPAHAESFPNTYLYLEARARRGIARYKPPERRQKLNMMQSGYLNLRDSAMLPLLRRAWRAWEVAGANPHLCYEFQRMVNLTVAPDILARYHYPAPQTQ